MEPVVAAVDVDHALAAVAGAVVAWRNAQAADAREQVRSLPCLVVSWLDAVAQYDRRGCCG